MGWTRTKALTTELPPAPSLIRWFLSGVLMAIAGVLLFILHASGTMKILAEFNIWWVSLAPPGIWLTLFCLRGWLWGKEVDEYEFLQKEAARAQKLWEAWAERHLAILGSCLFLPDNISAVSLPHTLPQQYGLIRKIDYLPGTASLEQIATEALLKGTEDALRKLPADLPLKVVLIADLPAAEMVKAFAAVWTTLFPERALPDDITVNTILSMGRVEERLQQPLLTVELFLVVQLRGGEAYSDGLAALLLTSDDVAQKYHLPHPARLLRPMPLDIARFDEDLRLFLNTQTVACRTTFVLEDHRGWEEMTAALITTGHVQGAAWGPSERISLEKWSGIPGPASPWLLTALAADLVSRNKTSLLMLLASGEERFISTVTSGSENEHIG
ncbi:hypothetical protein EDF81_0252 [Enterobacter sp. BIGb0383]|uniref:type VI secretion protein n=1 Tax=unclassified Enterobacter TaxID=2608935 RepID=UPI000F468AC7|nr:MULTISPECIES: type VI secretion protein [unclassified Enterobacter]ROP61778.1 hypothetical protein EDF81_0252 [Enterobacter sp. BIGb0383]ROS11939.1 hypothetical protein EC848_0252 [Enterobacter sp. BIGb0359]